MGGMLNRRSFFGSTARGLFGAALGAGFASALPGLLGRAFAAAPARKRFVFVINQGGWDPLNALTPMFDAPNIAMPVLSVPARIGGIDLVDSEQRPSVRSYFEAHAARTAIL